MRHPHVLSGFPECRISGNPEVPDVRKSGYRISGNPDIRNSGYQEIRNSGYPKIRKSGYPKFRKSRFPDFRISGNPEFRKPGFPHRVAFFSSVGGSCGKKSTRQSTSVKRVCEGSWIYKQYLTSTLVPYCKQCSLEGGLVGRDFSEAVVCRGQGGHTYA